MKVIGLCGQSGAGKGLVCAFFDQFNVKCIDTDKVYHDIISQNSDCTEELVNTFGEVIASPSGIDRNELRKIAFSSDENLKKINEITHKHILKVVREKIRQIRDESGADGIIVDAPLLFESGFDKECDATIAVVSARDNKIERIVSRDGISRDYAVHRLSSQIPEEHLVKMCTYVLDNDSTKDTLKDKVFALKQIIFDK